MAVGSGATRLKGRRGGRDETVSGVILLLCVVGAGERTGSVSRTTCPSLTLLDCWPVPGVDFCSLVGESQSGQLQVDVALASWNHT